METLITEHPILSGILLTVVVGIGAIMKMLNRH